MSTDYMRATDVFSEETLSTCRQELNDKGIRCATVRFPSVGSVRGAAMPLKLQAIRAVVNAKLEGASYAEAGVAAEPFIGKKVTRQTASTWFGKYADAVRQSNDTFAIALEGQ